MTNDFIDPSAYDKVKAEFDCQHTNCRIVRFRRNDGVYIVRKQCQRCGNQVGSTIPKNGYDIERLPDWDIALKDEWYARRSKRYQEAWEQQRNTQSQEWFARYNTYLNSAHWKNLRLRVLERDHYRCQNCFKVLVEQTAHVHHISYKGYDKLGYSFVFECVTLCRECHLSYHRAE